MKDVCTHSGNQCRELYYPASPYRNISESGQLAHNSKRAVFTTQAVYISTLWKIHTANRSKQHSGLCLLWKKSLQASCLELLLHEARLYFLDLPPIQSTHQHVQCLEDGVHGKGSIWEEWRKKSSDCSQHELTHLKEPGNPKCHDAAACTLPFNTSPFHQTARLLAFTTCPRLQPAYRRWSVFPEGQRTSECHRRRRHSRLPLLMNSWGLLTCTAEAQKGGKHTPARVWKRGSWLLYCLSSE